MTDRLRDKVAVITGSASGIGRASALAFAREGAQLVIADIDVDGNEALRSELEALGAQVLALQVDVTDEASIASAFAATAELGPLQVLFNCAGGSTSADGPVTELTVAVIEHTFRLDVQSAMLCSRAAIPLMTRGGSIVNMTSFAAFRGTVRIHAYAAAKGAIDALTRVMAGTYAKDGIRVNAIAPGVALSDRARRRITESNVAADLTFRWEDYPFAMGEPEDIANVALFLASEESRMVTGHTVMADGGLNSY
jgi:NAD(P)-dependent dehydrogenase (short-subunit alcohol dehydrogenase family)